MVNNRSKMQRSNGKAKAWLQSQGYKNIYFFPHGRFSKDYHITFGEDILDFDGVAHSDDLVSFFQVKSNCKATKRMVALYEEASKHFHIKCYWINSIDRKPLEVNNVSIDNAS